MKLGGITGRRKYLWGKNMDSSRDARMAALETSGGGKARETSQRSGHPLRRWTRGGGVKEKKSQTTNEEGSNSVRGT